MAKFASNNIKNTITAHMLYKLNCSYQLCVSFEENIDLCFQSKTAEKLFSGLRELMTVY